MLHAVVGIIQRDNKLLVAERPRGKSYSGYWEFPGGKIEANETSLAAIKRELHEELGIEVDSAKLWHEYTHTYPDKTVFLQLWLIDTFHGEPMSKENQALRWVSWDELQTLHLLEGIVVVLDKIKTLYSETAKTQYR